MTPQALLSFFRKDVVDVAAPYLWSDEELYLYMQDAYVQFVRLRGGTPDATSDVTTIPMVAGEAYAAIDPRILKIRRAFLASNNQPIELLNVEDLPMVRINDYGASPPAGYDLTTGHVRYMVIGEEETMVRWIQVPDAADSARLVVYRLPLNEITGADGDEFTDVPAHHHQHLTLWMKHRAYAKQDTETFDKGRSEQFRAAFETYCTGARLEWARQKSKTRVTRYGGV